MQPAPRSTEISPPSRLKRKGRVGGLGWVLIGIAGLFVIGGLMSILRTQRPPSPSARSQPPPNRSYFGANEFINASDGGVTFSDVYPPDSPTDKAGLVGGDIITTVDGHAIKTKNDMSEVLAQTPVGKTVDVTYVRDGQPKKTKLTTISAEQFEQLVIDFENRSVGHGALGFENPETAPIEGRRIFGVRLNSLSASGPAALAGIQEGDIVIEWDGIPIRTRGEFLTRVRRAIPYSTVKVLVARGSQQLEIPVKIGKRD
jgi:S1-C subfamily serine protease